MPELIHPVENMPVREKLVGRTQGERNRETIVSDKMLAVAVADGLRVLDVVELVDEVDGVKKHILFHSIHAQLVSHEKGVGLFVLVSQSQTFTKAFELCRQNRKKQNGKNFMGVVKVSDSCKPLKKKGFKNLALLLIGQNAL